MILQVMSSYQLFAGITEFKTKLAIQLRFTKLMIFLLLHFSLTKITNNNMEWGGIVLFSVWKAHTGNLFVWFLDK